MVLGLRRVLLHRAWFRRAWVVQELALAPEAQFEMGFSYFDWDMFFWMVKILILTGLAKVIEDLAESELRGLGTKFVGFGKQGEFQVERVKRDRSERSIHFRRDYGWAPIDLFVDYLHKFRAPDVEVTTDSKLMRLFSLGINFDCSNPRDKIYAFLSLARRDVYRTGREHPKRRPLEVRYQDSLVWSILKRPDMFY